MRLKPRDVSATLGINRRLTGGEAIITSISEDSKGTVYTVSLKRNGKTHSARRESLEVHYKLSKVEQAKRKKRADHVAKEKAKKKANRKRQ